MKKTCVECGQETECKTIRTIINSTWKKDPAIVKKYINKPVCNTCNNKSSEYLAS